MSGLWPWLQQAVVSGKEWLYSQNTTAGEYKIRIFVVTTNVFKQYEWTLMTEIKNNTTWPRGGF